MKAELMTMIDSNEPQKDLFGIKVKHKRKYLYVYDKNVKDLYSTTSIEDCHKMVDKINVAIASFTIDDVFNANALKAQCIELSYLLGAEAG